MKNENKSVTIENKKAYHDYYIEETLECGIELRGNEVKSVRRSKASIKEAWVVIENGQAVVKQMHIKAWDTSNSFDVDEIRVKKLLLHKKEIAELGSKVQRDGYTLVPLKVYFNKYGKCKMLIGLAKGKHDYDKRQVEKEKEIKKDINRTLKNRG